MTKINYNVGDQVRINLGRGDYLEGSLESITKINGDGMFRVEGKPYFTHRLPSVTMGEDGKSIIYNQKAERREGDLPYQGDERRSRK